MLPISSNPVSYATASPMSGLNPANGARPTMSNNDSQAEAGKEKKDFPWHLGVYDAHCHPTDTVSSVDKIPYMKTRALTIMATRAQDQDLVAEFAEKLAFTRESVRRGDEKRFIVPAFGWHPWFSHQIYDDSSTVSRPSRETHYQEILSPSPTDAEFLQSLPHPRPLSALLDELRNHLEQFHLSLVGEIGLDRAFRIPGTNTLYVEFERDPSLTPGGREGRRLSPYRVLLSHQRKVLLSQLNLAGEMQRAVSIHGVAAHGAVYNALRETWRGHERQAPSNRAKKRQAYADAETRIEQPEREGDDLQDCSLTFPPRVCLHSYSGPPETLKQYLHPSLPAKIFFSFSSLVNFSSSQTKALDVIKIVPDDRILVESDLHAAGEGMDDLMEDITRKVCHIKGWSLTDGVHQLASNWMHFVFGDPED